MFKFVKTKFTTSSTNRYLKKNRNLENKSPAKIEIIKPKSLIQEKQIEKEDKKTQIEIIKKEDLEDLSPDGNLSSPNSASSIKEIKIFLPG